MNLEIDTFKEGNCYIFNTAEDKNKNYGFMVINIIKHKGDNYINCALIYLQKEGAITLPEFRKGSLYTHVVYSPKGNKLGILVYDFHENNRDVLQKFKYVGQLTIDKTKFTIGTGTGGSPEPQFSKRIKYVEIVRSKLDKTQVEKILA